MQKIILVFILSLGLISSVMANTVYQDTQNHLVETKNLKGKWIIVNFWAEWCGPCVKEIPELNHFYKTNTDKNVVLYGVYYDQRSLDDLKQVARHANIEFPVLSQDPTPEWQLGEVSILPTTFIINPHGDVVKTIYGASTESNLLSTLHQLQQQYASRK